MCLRYVSGWGSGCGLAPLSLAGRGPAHLGGQGRLGGGGSQRTRWLWRRASARHPGPELVRVAYRPDVRDPVACDVECVHRHGGAVLLGDQAGLAVDRALQDRQPCCPAGEVEQVARDLLPPFGRAEPGAGEAAGGTSINSTHQALLHLTRTHEGAGLPSPPGVLACGSTGTTAASEAHPAG